MQKYISEMQRCIELAKLARGKTSPNPMVGCVILDVNNNVISEAYHSKCGENHAEREALLKLKDAKNCTLVVNLEPCCHSGKTPPCTDIIIEKNIKRVVYGMKDPNPLVSGNGLQKLKDAGIEVIGPVLEDECIKLNEIFIKNKTKNRPFVAIKTATTLDGKISTASGDSKWITSEVARQKAHDLRNFYDAILTSSSTIIADNPSMVHKNKIILDRNLKTNLSFNIYKQGNIYVFYDRNLKKKNQKTGSIRYIPSSVKNDKLDIDFILNYIYEIGITSIFVEAGGILNSSFLPYVDKLYHFIAPKILGDNTGKSCFDGLKTDKISGCYDLYVSNIETIGTDVLIECSKI